MNSPADQDPNAPVRKSDGYVYVPKYRDREEDEAEQLEHWKFMDDLAKQDGREHKPFVYEPRLLLPTAEELPPRVMYESPRPGSGTTPFRPGIDIDGWAQELGDDY